MDEHMDHDPAPGNDPDVDRRLAELLESAMHSAGGPEPPSARPSRQHLVVEPQPSLAPLVLGAVLCGSLGFGLVFGLGIGRSPRSTDGAAGSPTLVKATTPPAPAAEDAAAADPAPPRLLPPGPGAEIGPPTDRYDTRMASLEAPPRLLQSDGDERALTRSAREPARESFRGPAPDQGPRLTALEPEAEPAPVDPPAAPAALEPPPADVQPARPVPHTAPPVPFAAAPGPDLQPPPEPLPPGDVPAATDARLQPPPSLPPRFPAGPFAGEPSASRDLPQTPSDAAPAAGPPRLPEDVSARPVNSRFTAPTAAPVAAQTPAGAALPFAAAPPLAGPQPAIGDQPGGLPGAARTGPAKGGQGRPGSMQLEGLQSPQLAVEKRGPREVQVGKAARYEILVRNAGSAVAHDVVLRDTVPQGATLVTTTPPASPAGDSDDLVWPLGPLEPGGQARVVIEVMPQVEGEIGSVASVSFRTDASIRSRATKPDLTLEASEPRPVLIGRDIQCSIRVANPGTGVATGVVLEGFLPENVSHRSGRELEFDVGQLRPGESRTIDLVLGTRGPGVHAARFAARADGGLVVDRQVRLEVTAPTLELGLDMPLRRFLQRPATCTLAVTNAGTAAAQGIELAAQLPPGLKFVRANNAGWHDDRTQRVLWSLEELPAGETGTVEMVVMPVAFGPQKITAAARTADGLSHQATHVCEVEGLAALSFQLLDSEDPIEVGGLTEYVVRVTNQGTRPATGVRLSAALLGDLEPVAAEGPVGHRLENLTIVFEPLVKLAPAEEAVFRIRVRGRRAGDQRVQVQLVSTDHQTAITKEEITRVYDDR